MKERERIVKAMRFRILEGEDKRKRIRAYGGCLGSQRRRRTWQAAKSCGEVQATVDPRMSEWGNLIC